MKIILFYTTYYTDRYPRTYTYEYRTPTYIILKKAQITAGIYLITFGYKNQIRKRAVYFSMK